MLKNIFKNVFLFPIVLLLGHLGESRLLGAEYQWSVTVEGSSHVGLDPDYPRAFLWIPPDCKRVRAIILSQNNMEEESILEDKYFRKTLSDLGFAEIWVSPSLGSSHFRFDQGADQVLNKTLAALAQVSGYQELEFAPLVPIGHSAAAGFGWDIAAWNPGRTLAVLSISGQWPYYKDANLTINGSPDWGERTVDGVPGLTTKGEYEIQGNTDGWYFHLKGDFLKQHPQTVFTQVVEPGGGHFAATPEKIALISLYLRKAAQYRLPADAPLNAAPTLTPIDPTKSGWLFDEWHLNQGPASPAAPVADYQGDRSKAFWAFDDEMAKAIEDFQGRFKGKLNVLLGYQQENGLVQPKPDHAMVHLHFEPQADGQTIKLRAGFWDTVPPTPDEKVAEWQGWLGEGNPIAQGAPVPHPQDGDDKIVISRICGPILQTAADTFVIHPYRIGSHDLRKSNDVWLVATFPGDDTYKPMQQQADLRFPLTNMLGTPQSITFPSIPDQIAGASPITLAATSSSGAPVSYYVREGPAEVAPDGKLILTAIPPRAKYPIKVTVIACQWGRSIDPKLQTADSVEQTFSVTSGPETH